MSLAKLLGRLVLGRRLPQVSGSLSVPGLDGEVLVRRDRWGIPYIRASTDHDAWVGLGFCHAQDRAFQMESYKRTAAGTLSEGMGRRGLIIDRLARRLGFVRSAREQLSVLGRDELEMISAYCEGVRLGLLKGRGVDAHEFAMINMPATPWTPLDVLAVAKLMSFAMSANWDAELARFNVLVKDGPEALAAVDPDGIGRRHVGAGRRASARRQIDRLSKDMAALTRAIGLSGGSNAWVIAPARTASGRPILANDPHLPPRVPAPWYLAHIDSGDWKMAGATYVGVPIVASGHNGSVAWGITLGLADTSDLSVAPAGEKWAGSGEVEIIEEEISVRGADNVTEQVVMTPRGPQISSPEDESGYSFFLRATWMEPKPIGGLMRAHRAQSCEELRQAFAEWPLMSLNVVFADVSGSIGWQMAGEVPVRRKGSGMLPSPAWDPAWDWKQENVPFGRMPGSTEPRCGFVVSANQSPPSGGSRPFLGVDWADDMRASRIAVRLSDSTSWDISDAAGLQTDVASVQWLEVRERILSIQPRTESALMVLLLLADWDGEVRHDSAAAAAFELLMARIDILDVDAHAPTTGDDALGGTVSDLGGPNLLAFRRSGRLGRILRDRGRRDDPDWDGLLSRALDDTAGMLAGKGGRDPSDWQWGSLRPLMLKHSLSRGPIFRGTFDVGPFHLGGDTNTVWQSAVDPLDPLGNPLVIPSLRCVIDVGDFDRSIFSMAGGQSGNPFSPHYADLVQPWARGEGVPIAWSKPEVDRAAVNTLALRPVKPQPGQG